MNNSIPLAAALAAICAVSIPVGALAQSTPIEVWQPPNQRELDPAKQVPQAPQSTQAGEAAPTPAAPQPQAESQPQSYATPQPPRPGYEPDRGGFFIGAYGGKGWVFEDVDQTAYMGSAGYRWQAGPIALLGIEVAGGRVDDRSYGRMAIPSITFGSVGFNGRFNFGRGSQVFGLVRSGYWSSDVESGPYADSVDGGYVGLGLGVDFSRNVNATLVYTHYLYFDDYVYSYDDINSAETLMLGVEARF